MIHCAFCHDGITGEGVRYTKHSPGPSKKKAAKGAKKTRLIEEKHFCCFDHYKEWIDKVDA